MIEPARKLHDLGFAIHWLKPRSKKPLEDKWTRGARKTWAELEASYQYGYNVGVRLGAASRVGDGHLCVIDCDVKSADPKHRAEMEEKLKELISVSCPTVASGRGNGSCHRYVLTRAPAHAFRFAQSREKVKVLMPSASKPSRADRDALRVDELEAGFRMRPAWEISVMGEGQQVVLPPSIHPDTGGPYVWSYPPDLWAFPTMDFGARAERPHEELNTDEDIKFPVVDLIGSSLPGDLVEAILSGKGVENRSDSLLPVACRMLEHGFKDDEILSVLTDPTNFLGQTGYDHRNTKSRKRAADWIRKYTLLKARRETLAEEQFKAEVDVRELSPVEAEAQEQEFFPLENWEQDLDRCSAQDGGRPKSTLKNVNLILKNAVSHQVFKRDLFSGTDVYGVAPPWNGARVGQEVRNIDATNIVHWLLAGYRVEFPEAKIYQVIAQIASENPFHPVRDFLETLSWDGVPRLDTWLQKYLGAEGDPNYLAAVSRKTLCAMIARVMRPGIKYDQVLILEGLQGVGKSTAVRILADPWFSDAHINIADKDATIAMRSVWIMEMGELSGMRKADVDQLKEFISRQIDRIRMPYGRLAEDFPRQCIFIGTTNSSEYLKDTTGNRRFWPVKVGQCDLEGLKRDRDQILAEAKFVHELREPLYLETKQAQAGAEIEQEARVWVDEWVTEFGNFLAKDRDNFNVREFTIGELLGPFGAIPRQVATLADQMRAGSALKSLGYEKVRKRINGVRHIFWRRGHT